MKTSKFADEQIATACARRGPAPRWGRSAAGLGVSEQTFYRWKKRFGALGVSELREL